MAAKRSKGDVKAAANTLAHLLSDIMKQGVVDYDFLFGDDPLAWERVESAFRTLGWKDEAESIREAREERFEED